MGALFTVLQVALAPQAHMQAAADRLDVGCGGIPSFPQPLHGPPAQPQGPSASPLQSRRRSATTSWHQRPTHAPLQGSGFQSEHSIERVVLPPNDVRQHESKPSVAGERPDACSPSQQRESCTIGDGYSGRKSATVEE